MGGDKSMEMGSMEDSKEEDSREMMGGQQGGEWFNMQNREDYEAYLKWREESQKRRIPRTTETPGHVQAEGGSQEGRRPQDARPAGSQGDGDVRGSRRHHRGRPATPSPRCW